MPGRILFPSALVFLVTVPLNAQQTTGMLRGFVRDSTDGEAIGYVNIVIEGTDLGASTNSNGYFVVPALPPGTHTLSISHLGYEKVTMRVHIRPDQITDLLILLQPGVISSPELVVTGTRPRRATETNLGLQTLSARQIARVPQPAGPDILRSLQVLPGVSFTSDVSARYYVRGGGSDQNLVLLNGATIYYPFHTLGIHSVIDPEVVALVEFYKGGFPPNYGGRLSSVLNAVSRDGNRNRIGGTASVSLLSGKLLAEGPLLSGSFLLTGRKSWYSGLMKKYLKHTDAPFDFYDLYGKVNYPLESIDPDSRVVLFGFRSGDQVIQHDLEKADYRYSNSVFGLNWYKVWSSPLYSVLTTTYSGFRGELIPNLSDSQPRSNDVKDITTAMNFTYIFASKDEFLFGFHSKFLTTTLRQTTLYGQEYSLDEEGKELDVFGDYRFYRWDRLGLSIGVRLKFVALSFYRPILFEPRFSISYLPLTDVTVKASLGWYSQEVATLTEENEVISVYEPWIITPDYLNSARAMHASLGLEVRPLRSMLVSLEGYYKPISNLIEVNPEKYTSRDRDFINVDGLSYGFEFLGTFQTPDIWIHTSYTLSWAFKEKDGERYHPRYDSRHTVSALVGLELGDGWRLSVSWIWKTGMPFTPIAGYYDRLSFETWQLWPSPSDLHPAIVWNDRPSGRLPPYHRLDIGFARTFPAGPAEITLDVSMINVYNRKNVFYLDKDSGEVTYMLPRFPSITLTVRI